MRNPARPAVRLLALVLAAACGQDDLSAPLAGGAGRPSLSGPSGSGFYWLPPMVKDPGPFPGTFDGGRSPVVRVLCTGAAGPGCPAVARFDGASEGPAKVTVDLLEQAYKSNWHTPATLELGAGKYRLEVSDDGVVLGLADLRVVLTQKEANGAPAGEIPLVRGQPFLIKFRIEVGTDPDPLPVPSETPISQAIPTLRYVALPGDYQLGHPEAPGLLFSATVLTISLQATATAGEVNALLRPLGAQVVGGTPFASGDAGGFLVLRLPTTTHQAMEAALAVLRASPLVRAAVQNHPVIINALPVRATAPGSWTWETTPQGGNWVFEVGRAPQMWHLNERVAASGRRPGVLVLDRNFWPSHEDLTYDAILSPDSMIVHPGLPNDRYHGTMVASVLGATFGNGRGLDGASPFARLMSAHLVTDGSEGVTQLRDVLMANPDIWVVNTSWGNGWTDANGNLTGAPTFRTATSNETGQLFFDMLLDLVARGRSLPHFVTAAGNDALDARLNGYASNAALRLNAAPITVVEALQQTGAAATLDPATFSNIGAHVSAGGASVLLAVGGNSYQTENGTSFAAPFVTGVISHLIALDPTLPFPTMASNPVRDLLIGSGQDLLSGAQPAVDGFAAVLALDQRNGNQAFAKALVDVDDGTPDGNERVKPDGGLNTSAATARDGVVDMRDFRRFRDWYLQATGAGSLLDGAPDHPKKDLNGDGVVEQTASAENVYPRGDFNGDGVIDGTARPFGKNGPALTDLGVLERFFSDPDYQASELANLLGGGDLRVDPAACTAATGAVTVRTTVEIPGAGTVKAISHSGPSQIAVITVTGFGGTTPYKVTLTGTDAGGTVVFSEETSGVVVNPGSDATIAPTCACPATPSPARGGWTATSANCSTLAITPAQTTVGRGQTRQFAAYLDGVFTTAVTWTATRGSITGAGLFTAPTTDGPVTITATSTADPSKSATAAVTVQGFGGLVISPTGAALGFGQTRLFSVVAGAGPYSWSTDSQAGSISSAGVFTAGSTEGEFFVGVTSPTGSAQARVIVDRWAGIYDGAVIRNAAGSNRTWSVGRYFNHPSSGRCTNSTLPCYFTGTIDFGSVTLDGCYFQPIAPGLDTVQGSCDYSGSVFPLGLSGVLTNTSLALEARSGDGTIVILFAMDKR